LRTAAVSEVTVDVLLRERTIERSDALVLLAHVLGADRAWLSAHPERVLSVAELSRYQDRVKHRLAGQPLAYLVGKREFWSLSLKVTPEVLIPRPETELLLELALERTPRDAGLRVLDLGTGSGALAIAVALERPGSSVVAVDISIPALDVAQENARLHGARIRFAQSDWFSALTGERFDLIVCNPPYVAGSDPHLGSGDLRFEPRQALEAGPTGLECIETVATAAKEHLVCGGWLVLEHGYDQGEACRHLLERMGYAEVSDHADLAGVPRAVLGRFDPSCGEH
jgi:release factor glutamine methyltransferase